MNDNLCILIYLLFFQIINKVFITDLTPTLSINFSINSKKLNTINTAVESWADRLNQMITYWTSSFARLEAEISESRTVEDYLSIRLTFLILTDSFYS